MAYVTCCNMFGLVRIKRDNSYGLDKWDHPTPFMFERSLNSTTTVVKVLRKKVF